MNYAQFSEWVQDKVDELAAFGVPRAEACDLMKAVEYGAISAEAKARSEDQFLLDFRRVGSAGMAERLGLSPGAVRARRNLLLKKRTPLTPALTQAG